MRYTTTTRRAIMFWASAGLPFFAGRGFAAPREVILTPALSGFSRIEAGHAFRVTVQQGSGHRVEIHADEDLASHLDVRTQGDRLILSMKQEWFSNWHNNKGVEVQVTMPTLRSYNGSGATHTTISGFRSNEPIDFELSGASRLEGNFDSGDIRLELSGASRANLTGRANALRLEASGASGADLGAFTVDRADLNLSGASHTTVNTRGRLDVDSSGASHVTYVGNPVMGRIESSGASSIRPGR